MPLKSLSTMSSRLVMMLLESFRMVQHRAAQASAKAVVMPSSTGIKPLRFFFFALALGRAGFAAGFSGGLRMLRFCGMGSFTTFSGSSFTY